MKKLMSIIICLFMLGCASNSVKIDGEVSAVEAALIRVPVAVALTAKPELIAPTYAISTAILAAVDNGTIDTIAALDEAVNDKLNGLTDVEKASAIELVHLITTAIADELNVGELTADQKLGVVRDVLVVVRDTAKARL